jgi:hypothetical protein
MATFSRFEFALKKAGYVLGDDTKVSPDWDGFARDPAQLNAAVVAPVLKASQYLQQHPPKKQVLQNRNLHWVDRQGTSGSVIGDVLLSVRTVRNNVCHGGKFPDGFFAEPLRDEALIRDCVAVPDALLELPLPSNVAELFIAGI